NYGCRDPLAFDAVEGLRILVKRHNLDFPGQIHAVQLIRGAFSAGSFQADDAVDFFLLLQQRGDAVISFARIAFVIDGLHDLDAGILFQRFIDASHALLTVELPDDGDNHHAALPAQQLRHALPALLSRPEVVRADEEHAIRARRVRINADDRNALQDGVIDGVLEQFRIGYGNEDARGMLRHLLLEGGKFLGGRKCRGPDYFHLDPHAFADIRKP